MLKPLKWVPFRSYGSYRFSGLYFCEWIRYLRPSTPFPHSRLWEDIQFHFTTH